MGQTWSSVSNMMQSPRDMTVMRELSVLLTALCSSSKAVIIFSIWACFPRESGWLLTPSALMPAELVPGAHLSTVAVVPSAAGLLLRRQFFRYWLGFSATSGNTGEWLRWGWGFRNPVIKKIEELDEHRDLVDGSCKASRGADVSKSPFQFHRFQREKDISAYTHILMGFHWITGCYGIAMAHSTESFRIICVHIDTWHLHTDSRCAHVMPFSYILVFLWILQLYLWPPNWSEPFK